MNKLWSDRAWDDYLYRQMQDKKTLQRLAPDEGAFLFGISSYRTVKDIPIQKDSSRLIKPLYSMLS